MTNVELADDYFKRAQTYYGDEDYLPSEEYDEQDAKAVIQDCEWLIRLLKPFFKKP